MHRYIHTYIHIYIRACIHTYINTHIHTCIYIYVHTYIHIPILWHAPLVDDPCKLAAGAADRVVVGGGYAVPLYVAVLRAVTPAHAVKRSGIHGTDISLVPAPSGRSHHPQRNPSPRRDRHPRACPLCLAPVDVAASAPCSCSFRSSSFGDLHGPLQDRVRSFRVCQSACVDQSSRTRVGAFNIALAPPRCNRFPQLEHDETKVRIQGRLVAPHLYIEDSMMQPRVERKHTEERETQVGTQSHRRGGTKQETVTYIKEETCADSVRFQGLT
jgi:hypothetical protein